jgi:hypothetical protein
MSLRSPRPGVRTPTSGVIIEMLYLCAVGLSAGIAGWAIGTTPRGEVPAKRTSQPPRRGPT